MYAYLVYENYIIQDEHFHKVRYVTLSELRAKELCKQIDYENFNEPPISEDLLDEACDLFNPRYDELDDPAITDAERGYRYNELDIERLTFVTDYVNEKLNSQFTEQQVDDVLNWYSNQHYIHYNPSHIVEMKVTE